MLTSLKTEASEIKKVTISHLVSSEMVTKDPVACSFLFFAVMLRGQMTQKSTDSEVTVNISSLKCLGARTESSFTG